MFQMYKDAWSLLRKTLNPVILQNESPRTAADRCADARLLFLPKWWLLSGGAGESGSGEPHLVPLWNWLPSRL